jgi:hypothetical protein
MDPFHDGKWLIWFYKPESITRHRHTGMVETCPAIFNRIKLREAMSLNWPLMENKIIQDYLDRVIDFLKEDPPSPNPKMWKRSKRSGQIGWVSNTAYLSTPGPRPT